MLDRDLAPIGQNTGAGSVTSRSKAEIAGLQVEAAGHLDFEVGTARARDVAFDEGEAARGGIINLAGGGERRGANEGQLVASFLERGKIERVGAGLEIANVVGAVRVPHRRSAGREHESVGAGAAVHCIDAGAGNQCVAAAATNNIVVARTGDQSVRINAVAENAVILVVAGPGEAAAEELQRIDVFRQRGAYPEA